MKPRSDGDLYVNHTKAALLEIGLPDTGRSHLSAPGPSLLFKPRS